MKKSLCIILFVLIPFLVFSQSNGINEVRQIESKAQQYSENKDKIAYLRNSLPGLQRDFEAKIGNTQREMDALIRERDSKISDMKVGARCSECNRWKTDLEKAGINFSEHLRDVKGRAIPATTSELEQIRKDYAERIAVKKVQINRATASDPLASAKKEITDLENINKRLCDEIYKHALKYKDILSDQIEAVQSDWMKQLFASGGSWLISQDQQIIYQDRKRRLQEDFDRQQAVLKRGLEEQASNKRTELSAQLKQVEAELLSLNGIEEDRKKLAEQNLVNLNSKIRMQELELTKSFVSDSAKAIAAKELNELKSNKAEIENENAIRSSANLEKKQQLEASSRAIGDQIKSLDLELPKLIADQTAQLKAKYDAELDNNEQLLQGVLKDIPIRKSNFQQLKVSLDAKNQNFFEVIVAETNRIAVASQKTNCYVSEGSKGQLVGDWNNRGRCVTDLVEARSVSSYYLTKEGDYCHPTSVKSYLSNYLQFLRGLSKDDLAAVQRERPTKYLEFLGVM